LTLHGIADTAGLVVGATRLLMLEVMLGSLDGSGLSGDATAHVLTRDTQGNYRHGNYNSPADGVEPDVPIPAGDRLDMSLAAVVSRTSTA
jgi:hypothetical protein